MKIVPTPNSRPKSPFHKKSDMDAPKPEKAKKEKHVKDERLFDVSKYQNWLC